MRIYAPLRVILKPHYGWPKKKKHFKSLLTLNCLNVTFYSAAIFRFVLIRIPEEKKVNQLLHLHLKGDHIG